MKLTTIQLYEDTKKEIDKRKQHPRESYNDVLLRILKYEEVPSMEEMFCRGDLIKQKKLYTTKEVIDLSHALRGK